MTRPRKDPMEKYRTASISFEPNQLEQLIDYCQKNERDMSWVIRKALEQWLEQHKDDHL